MPDAGRFLGPVRSMIALTFGSRVLGLVRECLFSHVFSTTELLSAFRIAFVIPNLARRLFGEGALSSSMIPVLTETLRKRGEEESRRFVGTILAMMTVVLVATVVAAEAGIALWRTFRADLALELAAVLLPYMILICLVAVIGGVLQVRRHFATPAAVPMIMNGAIIAGLGLGTLWGELSGIQLMYIVCGSVLTAGVLQLAASAVALRAMRFFPIFRGQWRDPQVRKVFVLMMPMLLGLSAVQINSLVDYVIAYTFVVVDGERVGPAVLGYAQYLYQLPLGVFGISLATAIFPVLSQKATDGDHVGLAEVVLRGVRLSLFVALPATVGLLFVSEPLVASLFEHGRFDADDTARVAAAVQFYSLGLVGYFVQHILVRAFYALHDSKTPARVAARMVGLNLALNLGLVFVLEERGLALATALCAWVQVVWLAVKLSQAIPELVWHRMTRPASKMLGATAAMALVLIGVLVVVGRVDWIEVKSPVTLVAMVLLGVAGYAAAARLMRIEELGLILHPRSNERKFHTG